MSKIVRILLDNGKVAEFAVEDITAVEFSPRKTPPPAAPDPAKAPPPITVTLRHSAERHADSGD